MLSPRRLSWRALAVPIAAASLVSVVLLTMGGQQGRLRLRQAWSAARRASLGTGARARGNVSRTSGVGSAVDGLSDLTGSAVVCPGFNPILPTPGNKSGSASPSPEPSISRARSLGLRLAGVLGMDSLQAALSTTEGTTGGRVGSRAAPARPGTTAADSALAAALGAGLLTVAVDTGAAMAIVDGVPRGTTPYVICLGAGRHTVSAHSISGSYQPARVSVSIGRGDTASVVFHRAADTLLPR